MDKRFQIGEIARFFDIPASTFRYWEEKGILHPGKKIENQYREYAIEDLMTISDVIFYKNLGLELKEIRGMDAATPEQHGKADTADGRKHNTCTSDGEITLSYEGVEDIGGIENTGISRV